MYPHTLFINRHDAGKRLAAVLAPFRDEDTVVLALPRGGVVIGYEVARELNAPLDVLIVRKLGAPGFPELGLGAVVDGEHPQCIVNQRVVDAVQPPPGYLDEEVRRQLAVIEQHKQLFRHGRPPEPIDDRTVILVDDGIATGGTVRAALQALAQSGVARSVLAVPVAPHDVLQLLPLAERDFVCLHAPRDFASVGVYYHDFAQVSDAEAVELLELAALHLERPPREAAPVHASPRQ
jgi:putative phosphoribosyl transferase